MMIKIAQLGFLILFSGCMVGPDYHPPLLDVPQTFIYETQEAEGDVNLEWWNQFDDPILNGLISEALSNNKNVKIAAANIEKAVGMMIQIRAPLFPIIGYDNSYTRFRNSEVIGSTALPLPVSIPTTQTVWEATVVGNWDIDIWGRVRRQVENARANIFASYQARQNIILSLVASVANTYIQLRSLDEQLVISQNTKDLYHDSLKYFETQFEYGQTSKMTVAQAKTQYEIASSKVPQLKSQIVQTENAICLLLGSNPKSIPRGKTIYELGMPNVPPGLPSELLSQRPDIMEAEFNLIAANANIGAAKALYFPSISLTALYGGASRDLSKLFSGPATAWTFVGSVTGPLFTGGAIYGQVYQAESQQHAALIQYQETIQEAFADVENALISNIMLIDQLKSQKGLVEAAGEYQYLATLQYNGGYAPYFIVIQAQEQYFPAQLSWVQTRANLLSSLVDIYQALGGGWVVIAENMTKSCL